VTILEHYLQVFKTPYPKYIYMRQTQGIYSVFLVALEESFISVGVVAVFPYEDALLIFVIPIIFDNNKKTENKTRVKWSY
jgi:hypothetical protein